MKQTRYFSGILFLMVFALFSSGSTCKSTDPPASTDDCQNSSLAQNYSTVYAGGSIDMVSKPSNNDCEATYIINFEWAKDSLAKANTSMPPLGDLETACSPEDELLSYFTHDAPHVHMLSNGHNEWTLVLSTNNSKSVLSTTRYAFHSKLNSSNPADSVLFDGRIEYYAK